MAHILLAVLLISYYLLEPQPTPAPPADSEVVPAVAKVFNDMQWCLPPDTAHIGVFCMSEFAATYRKSRRKHVRPIRTDLALPP